MKTDDIELKLLLDAIHLKYGYDFNDYSRAHLKRRIRRRMNLDNIDRVADIQHRILHSHIFFETLLLDLSINVTEMFRDPSFYRSIREQVVPELKTYPFIKIWHAGCSTGEEIYSMAIVLQEEGILDRCQIYATDFNARALEKAKAGIYSMKHVQQHTQNYQKSGGQASFADYYTAQYDSVIMNESLKKKIVFADHNLVTDGVFGEINMIFCRNVLIYFNKELQTRVINLFLESLCPGGLLCLGSKESLRFTDTNQKFISLDEQEKIFRKSYAAH